MKSFHIVLTLSVVYSVFLFAPFVSVHAQSSDPSQPLDAATERRIDRYIRNDHCPVTFDTELNARCEYLLIQRMQRQRDMVEQRLLPRDQRAEEEAAVSDPITEIFRTFRYSPGGTGSEPLTDEKERSIQHSLREGSCPPNLNAIEVRRCLYLFYEEDAARQAELAQTSNVRRSRPAPVTPRTIRARVTVDSATLQNLVEQQRQETFDVNGPGSQPLSSSKEMRLKGYVNRDSCPVTFDTVLLQRCEYLVQKKQYDRTTGGRYARTEVRARLLIQTTTDARAARNLSNFTSPYSDILSTNRLRRESAGLFRRPTTRAQLLELGEPQVIQGDRKRTDEE